MKQHDLKQTRLGLDIGTNSIGWWLYETDGHSITKTIDGGVRIFSDGRDPKSNEPNAKKRRLVRSMRRQRDRYLLRRTTLMRKLSDSGLMPSDPKSAKSLELLDPYELRARALYEPLPLTHLGRALFHLNQRRGFKSNRKVDRKDNESGKIKSGTARLEQKMMETGSKTYGEFLHKRRIDKPEKPITEPKINADGSRLDDRLTKSVRTRLGSLQLEGKEEEGYDFYPDRSHLEEEFNKIWDSQIEKHRQAKEDGRKISAREWRQIWNENKEKYQHHLGSSPIEHDPYPEVLTKELKETLFKTIFYQRPLREPEVGLCLFSGFHEIPSGEKRLPKAHPLFQRRVLYETVNSLRIVSDFSETRPLSLEERNKIIFTLDNKQPTKSPKNTAIKFETLAKLIHLEPDEKFSLETDVRDSIKCDEVRASLISQDRFGSKWSELSIDAQWEIIQRIRNVQSDEDSNLLVCWLTKQYKLTKEQAEKTASAPLPDGFGRIGEAATRKILKFLTGDVVTYDHAVVQCGLHHSNLRTGEIFDLLPYYGEVLERHVIPGRGGSEDDEITRYGRITNPTVHIGLNQLRRLVNKIISVYGKPNQIVVELARELKLSDKQKAAVNDRIKNNTSAAKIRSNKLNELGQKDNGYNRLIMRLYEELGPETLPRCCPYSGKTISCKMLFDGSCDIDHILPYSRTMDDSPNNKTLCLKEANREKSNKTPWETWGDTDHWEKIASNLVNLPKNKRWRFKADAMEKFEGENDFVSRALKDTQYLSRISRTYLDTLYPKAGHVWVVPGRLTEMLRRHWGLNNLLSDSNNYTVKEKNRTDHRHHAIDAAVVAATDRGLVKQISQASARDEEIGNGAEKVARTTPQPWVGFRNDIKNKLDKIIVSHRGDHGKIDHGGKLKGQDQTAGQLHNDTAYGVVDEKTVVSRKPLVALTQKDIADSTLGKNIRDPYLKQLLSEVSNNQVNPKAKEFERALVEFANSSTQTNDKPNPYKGIRRVRMIENMKPSSRVDINDARGKIYKTYKGDSNHCCEIWLLPNGKLKMNVVSTFEAHRMKLFRPHPAAKLLLRIFRRDMVIFEQDGIPSVYYVQKMRSNGTIYLAPHNEANADARDRSKDDPFRFIQKSLKVLVDAKFRRVFVDELGHIRDPGALFD